MEDVVDTGLTLHYLVPTLQLRRPRVDRGRDPPRPALPPARHDLPVRFVGFTVPDELFVGYGFDLDERYRNLPDLHVFRRSDANRAA